MGRINRLIPTTTLTANSVIAMDAESGGATNKVTIQTLAAGLRSFGNYATQADLNAKQDVLTFDDAPEEDSDNPVTSEGIYNAIGGAMSNVYTKTETDNAIAQSTANLIVAEDSVITSPGTFNANASTRVTFPTVKTGYTRLGCIGLTGSGTSGLVIQEYYNASDSITVYYRNITSSAITPSRLVATVLYHKNAQ